MSPSDLSIATITWARSSAEETVLRRSLTCLAALGLPVAVADTGTNRAFSEFLRGLPGFAITAPISNGLVAQVQASVGLAAEWGTPHILYTEPDKELFFAGQVRHFIQHSEGPDVGVLLAARTAESFSTFPPMQRYTEEVINHLCAEFIGPAGDYCYGPFVMHRSLGAIVTEAHATVGWGWRPLLFRAAHRLGWRVSHAPGDYVCPAEQRDEDDADRTHRLRQLSDNILGLTV